MFGVTRSGFRKKRLPELIEEKELMMKNVFNEGINLSPESVFGQLIAIVAKHDAEIWDAAEAIYRSVDPSLSFGNSLDDVAAINGISRLGQTRSKVSDQVFFGDVGTVIPAESIVGVVDGNRFATLHEITLTEGRSSIQNITFNTQPTSGFFVLNFNGEDTNNLAYNISAEDIQTELNSLDFGEDILVEAGAESENFNFKIIFSGLRAKKKQSLIKFQSALINPISAAGAGVSATIIESSAGENQGIVDLVSSENGAVVGLAGSIIEIVSAIPGVTATINNNDAILGRNNETDSELRRRRTESLGFNASATVSSIQSKIGNIKGVQDVIIKEVFSVTDSEPETGIRIVVSGGDQSEIIDAIEKTRSAGIKTLGLIAENRDDLNGDAQVIRFSRPVNVQIFFELDLTVSELFRDDIILTIEQALVAKGNEFGIGKDIILEPVFTAVLAEFSNILGYSLRIGKDQNPTASNNINISSNQISTFSTSRASVRIL